MVTGIQIVNFKSAREHSFAPKGLNLLTGTNSAGKSTVLQAMLLLRQSYMRIHDSGGLYLGDDKSLVNLGSVQDVFNQNAEKKECLELTVEAGGNRLRFLSNRWDEIDTSALTLPGRFDLTGEASAIRILNGDFQYLSAERISPGETYPRSDRSTGHASRKMQLGRDGRFTAHYLDVFGNKDVTLDILNPSSSGRDAYSLNQMVTAWLQEISPNVSLKTQENLGTNRIALSYQYQLATDSGLVPTQDRKPQNVGFGLTQTLPILVAILGSDPGDVVLIENPETHLHPRAQSRLGMLMAMASEAGLQLFVETHSDHILNGIRVASHQRKIQADKVAIHYFSQDPRTGNSIVEDLTMTQSGRINHWPDGFFDEWATMLDALM